MTIAASSVELELLASAASVPLSACSLRASTNHRMAQLQ